MNYSEVLKGITTTILDVIKRVSKKLPYDKTFKAKVLGKLSDNKYKVLYRGSEYTASSEMDLGSDEIVSVCAPQNNWNNLFVCSVIKNDGSIITSGVSGVKGECENSYKTGLVNISKRSLGIEKVENKSSDDIRNELSRGNIVTALGFSPADEINVHSTVTHISRTDNPHKITKEQLGLEKADNTPDIDKHVLSAKKLEYPRKINGVDFDGTRDIQVSDNIVYLSKKEYDELDKNDQLDLEQLYITTDDESNNLTTNMSGYFTLAVENNKLFAYFLDGSTPPPFYYDEKKRKLYYDISE